MRPVPAVAVFAFALAFCLPAAPAASQVVRVPQDVRDLQGAFSRVRDGGVIEVAAGTYPSPPRGFEISGGDVRKSFTVRPAGAGARVVLDGLGSRALLRVQTANRTGKTVTFENLVFQRGASTTERLSGGVTVQRADVRFLGCEFLDNTASGATTGGGAALLFDGATVLFRNSTFARNGSLRRGGALEVIAATATVEGGTFADNRVNLPGHDRASTGGAVYLLNGTLNVTGARFERNQAGYAGGAINIHGVWQAPESTPTAEAIIATSTFTANALAPDPGSPPPGQTSGGAIHVEDQATLRLQRALFVKNVAEFGGAIDAYRAVVEILGSAFLGNHAPLGGPVVGAGGAVLVTSPDFNDGSTEGGLINRRPARLTIAGSLLRGRFEEVGATAHNGGCLYVDGDTNRLYGANGVAQMDPPNQNRARVVLRNSVFADCDVQETADGRGGAGGAIFADVVDLTLDNSLIFGSDARGRAGSGGGLLVRRESVARITNTTFAGNTAQVSGGGLFVSGSTLDVAAAQFLGNVAGDRGAAVLTRPLLPNESGGPGRAVDGTVAGSLFSDSAARAVFDLRIAGGPNNDVRYNGNRFENAPTAGALFAIPPAPAGAPGASLPPALAYAWSGRSATLDGETLGARAGLVPAAGFGEHRLVADGVQVGAARLVPASCTLGGLLCLSEDRFRLEVQWKNGNQSGAGQALALTRDTGTFWFFDEANLELVVKMVDGRALNGRFWVFFGALTDREYTLKVTDTRTGRVKSYRNPPGRVASVADTAAFPDTAAALAPDIEATQEAVSTADFEAFPEAVEDLVSEAIPAIATRADLSGAAQRAACNPSPAQLCFDGGRIRATLAWSARGQSGAGQAVQLTGDTGYFTFFDPNNVELVVKVLNAGALNGQYWVFYGALSDVQYTLTVTDTATGRAKTYNNPQGTLASRADTAALPTQ